MFYCGFGGDYCGQSKDDDVNHLSTYVILAFVNTVPSGAVVLDEANFPTKEHAKWKKAGKKVIISVGGQNGIWSYIFASNASIANFCKSVKEIITKWDLDGIDIDIESYMVTPRTVANMLIELRATIGT